MQSHAGHWETVEDKQVNPNQSVCYRELACRMAGARGLQKVQGALAWEGLPDWGGGKRWRWEQSKRHCKRVLCDDLTSSGQAAWPRAQVEKQRSEQHPGILEARCRTLVGSGVDGGNERLWGAR